MMSLAIMPPFRKQVFVIMTMLMLVIATDAGDVQASMLSATAPLFANHGARCVRIYNSAFECHTEFASMANMQSGVVNCPNLLAVFQDTDQAVEFLDSDLAFGFVRPTSLAVAVVQDGIGNVSRVAEVMTTRAFKSALEVALVAKVRFPMLLLLLPLRLFNKLFINF